MIRRKLQTCGRPKAFWGAVIPAAVGLIGSAMNAYNSRKNQQAAIDAQNKILEEQNKRNALQAEASGLNNYFTSQQDAENQRRLVDNTIYARGGKRKLKNGGIFITDGGSATPIDSNTFLLRGSKHSQVNESGNTGIGINVNGRAIEAEGGEVTQHKGNELRIFSDNIKLPRRRYMRLGGSTKITPAEAVLEGYNKDKVFAAQEDYKRKHNIKTGRKALKGASFYTGDYIGLGVNTAASLLSGLYANNQYNKLRLNYVTPEYYEETPVFLNTDYSNAAQQANVDRNRLSGRQYITRNVASANVGSQRTQELDTNALYQKNELADTKSNKEAELRNANLINIQNVRARNVAARNKWASDVATIRNQEAAVRLGIQEAKLNSNVGMIQGVADSVGGFLQSGINNYQAEQARNLQFAGSEKGTLERAVNLGYKIDRKLASSAYQQAISDVRSNPDDTGARERYDFWRNYFASRRRNNNFFLARTKGVSAFNPIPLNTSINPKLTTSINPTLLS